MDKEQTMTKGQIEAKISEIVSKFEREVMGRGPEQIRTLIVSDLMIIRLTGYLSPAEKKLAQTGQGIEKLKGIRTMLFEDNINYLEEMIEAELNIRIESAHSDVSTRTGEKIIVLEADIPL